MVNLKKISANSFSTVKKYPVLFCCSMLGFVFSVIYIFSDLINIEAVRNISWRLIYGAVLGFLCSFTSVFFIVRLPLFKKTLVQLGAAACGFACGFLVFHLEIFADNSFLYWFGTAFALCAVIAFMYNNRKNDTNYLSILVKDFLFTFFLSVLLFIALAIVLYAVDSLIYELSYFEEIMMSLFCLCIFTVFPLALVSRVFTEKGDRSAGKAFRILTLYTLFPVYGILITVLYLYLVKSIVTVTLPGGMINWFVSYSMCLYLFFYFCFEEYKDKTVVRLFYKAGKYILIPLLVIQIIAFVIRIHAYGFTVSRYFSLLYIIFSVLFIVNTFIKNGKYSSYFLIVLATLILFASVSPFNGRVVAFSNQMNRMTSVMKKYDMIDGKNLSGYDRKLVNAAITETDRTVLEDSFEYLKYNKKHPKWMTKNFTETFGLDPVRTVTTDSFFYTYQNGKYFNISEYEEMKPFSEYTYKESDTVKIAIDTERYDITEYLLSLDSGTVSEKDELFFQIDDNTRLVFSTVNYRFRKMTGEFFYVDVRGYILKK